MTSNRIKPELFERLKQHPRIKGKISEQTIRNAISDIRRDNPGISMNAAAHVFAESRGFSLFRSLDEEDKLSLQHRRQPSMPILTGGTRSSKTGPKEAAFKFGAQFIDDGNRNASAYPYVYVLENSMRQVILKKFEAETNWWTDSKYVKRDIQDYSTRIQDAERRHAWLPSRGSHPIYYVGLDELFRIVEMNWSRFKDVFEDLGNLRTWINETVPLRNMIAHNVPTRPQDRKNVEIRSEYICTLIDKA